MFKRSLLATVLTIATAGVASAAPVSGSFGLTGAVGSYIGGTASTATGLDFGYALFDPAAGHTFTGVGNGFGTNGSAVVYLGTGSFAGFNNTYASIADIALGATANPYNTNPFLSLGGGAATVSFSDATITRTGTSVTVAGTATFSDGIAADTTTGMFSIAADSQGGNPNSINFTFSGNASAIATAVPEPVSLALLGTSLVGFGALRSKRRLA